ncbi:MAG: DNA-binding protein [Candidatus Eremiobacteraeota bacterium]|nr:DNA-binding protein [Candidatus Eremiobacteraeota bacterium]
MQFTKVGNTFCIRIMKGEELVETLTEFLQANNLKSGYISGIGATDDVTLGYFDAKTGEYNKKDFQESFEILNLTGNVSSVGGKSFVHMHVTLGKEDFSCIGGHLFRANISVTCEIYLKVLGVVFSREHDSETGLKLLALK